MRRSQEELIWVERLVRDIALDGHVESWPDDPPDAVITTGSGLRIAVEVTELFARETRHGSPDRERARGQQRLLNKIRDEYYSREGARLINVRAHFPPRIESSEQRSTSTPDGSRARSQVRLLTRSEQREDERCVQRDAVSQLRGLEALGDGDTVRLEVRLPIQGGYPIRMAATGLPEGNAAAREHATQWRSSPGPGWVADARAVDLQARVAKKSNGVRRYRSEFSSKILLLVAAASGPGSFLAVTDDLRIEPMAFDAVFFMRFLDGTRCIGGAYDRVR